jgi:hypothetical protein
MNEDKLKNSILQICEVFKEMKGADESVPTNELIKILYVADMLQYKETGETITCLKYFRGENEIVPDPEVFPAFLDSMVKEGLIKISS